MPRKRDEKLLIDAARMYYVEGRDQGQIADLLELSRSSISRMLRAAREQGIVQVTIVGDSHIPRDINLESQLLKRFGLVEAIVAADTSSTMPMSDIAHLAAQVFDDYAPDATRIGISWGATISSFVDALQPRALHPSTQIIPLVGGLSIFDLAPSGNTSIQNLADKCRLQIQRFDAPAIVESASTYHAMMSESSIKTALTRAASCDLAFVGMGTFGILTSRQVIDYMKLTPLELAKVVAANPAGDMNGQYFDVFGTPLGPPASERVLGINIEQLRSIGTLVALASGPEKALGVLGGLRTGAINILVTDAALVHELLRLADKYV